MTITSKLLMSASTAFYVLCAPIFAMNPNENNNPSGPSAKVTLAQDPTASPASAHNSKPAPAPTPAPAPAPAPAPTPASVAVDFMDQLNAYNRRREDLQCAIARATPAEQVALEKQLQEEHDKMRILSDQEFLPHLQKAAAAVKASQQVAKK